VAAPTALERAVADGADPARATPLDALRIARRIWLAEGRVDMGALASELRISRATLYNWVGDRDRLTAEVLWSMTADLIARAKAKAKGRGAAYLSEVNRHYLTELAAFAPSRRFIERDPEVALRVLTSAKTPYQRRLIDALTEMIDEQVDNAGYVPPLDPPTLAYLIIRIGESFIFNDVITGSEPDLDKAMQASRVLFHAAPLLD
jgi:AcrR family transcriptional regulator